MPGSWLLMAALAVLQTQAPAQVVVTAAPPLDAQRLADALRVYLDGFGIRVQTHVTGEAGDLLGRLDEARQLGEAVRAVAVVRAERGAPGSIAIEVSDLATHKAIVATLARPARDEDLYRALALKIQSVLRATLSEARADLDPRSSLGRLVSGDAVAAKPEAAPLPGMRLGLDAGYGFVSFPFGGPLFGGLALRASWRPIERVELALATAALGSVSTSRGDVEAVASIVPLRVTGGPRARRGPAELLLGPCAEMTWTRIAVTSTSTPVRSTSNVMFALGVEAEARVRILTSAWLFARGAALGVLNGERYDVVGVPVVDTSRLQLSGTIGAGVGLP